MRRILILFVMATIWLFSRPRASRGADARRCAERDGVSQHRTLPDVGMDHRDRRAGELRSATISTRSTRRLAAAGSGKRQQRHHVDADLRQRRGRSRRRRRDRAVEPEHRLDGHRRSGQRAFVVLRQRRLQVRGRRQDLAVDGPSRFPPHRAHRHPSDESRMSSTSRRWATCSRATRSAASSGRAMAARRGTRCSTSTTGPARPIS